MNTTATTLIGKTILLVHAGSNGKKFILEVMKKLGVHIICLNREVFPVAAPYIDEWIIEELNNIEDSVRQVKEFQVKHSEIKIDGVITFWDECILLTSRIADELGLVGIPFVVSDTIKNKNSFRDACEKQQLEAPKHQMVRSVQDIDNLNPALAFPLVIKPVYGASSAFVKRVENKKELKKAYQDTRANINSFYLAPEWRSHDVLVEEYIDGDEVDVDTLIQGGKIVFMNIIDNAKTNEPYFVETGWSCPSGLSPERKGKMVAMVAATLEKLGVRDGLVHFEAKSKLDGTAVPIEVNLRMGGHEVYSYSKLIWGVDLIENALRIAVGFPVIAQSIKTPKCFLISHRFLSDVTCRIVDASVDDKLKEQDYFIDFYFEINKGQIFKAPPDGYDGSIGILTVSGTNRAEAERNLDEAKTFVHFSREKINQ